VLLDRRRAKVWQKVVFALMALIMVGSLGAVAALSQFGCGNSSPSEQIAEDIAAYEKALDASPSDATALRGLGDSYVSRANQQAPGSDAQQADWRLAIEQYEKAVRVLAERDGAETKAERVGLLEEIVSVNLFLGDYQAAANVYPRIVKLAPDDPQVYFQWAEIAVSAGDSGVALLAFGKFLELDPDSPHAADVKDWIEENTKPTGSSSQEEETGP
jgi:tetratricopeptide (TPR) repeat protein